MRARLLFSALLVGLCAWLAASGPALAWTRPGHMVTADIVYDELAARDPRIIDQIIEIMSHHPERGPFEVAIGRATGPDLRARRISRLPQGSAPGGVGRGSGAPGQRLCRG
jgi:hypothetical protein